MCVSGVSALDFGQIRMPSTSAPKPPPPRPPPTAANNLGDNRQLHDYMWSLRVCCQMSCVISIVAKS